MQLVNETRLPNDVLRPLLAAAARKAGAKTGHVLVRVKWGWKRPNATVHKIPHWWRIKGRTHWGITGYVEMVLDRTAATLELAEWFWGLAVHEWHHIAWGQRGNEFRHDVPYREREHEIEAFACQHRAEEKVTLAVQDMILDLALAREALKKR